MEQLTVEQWRERILAGWEKWGTGVPLDPRTVELLAQEFAKPMQIPIRPLVDFYSDSMLYPDTSKMPRERLPFMPHGGYGGYQPC